VSCGGIKENSSVLKKGHEAADALSSHLEGRISIEAITLLDALRLVKPRDSLALGDRSGGRRWFWEVVSDRALSSGFS